ncbi:hypothetical protein C6495_11600 [Candidatus Poribacteria bacterium]|nr:MAG: hypothetical protein C6495_11600 [Candidatus Poribacteria bacterium]
MNASGGNVMKNIAIILSLTILIMLCLPAWSGTQLWDFEEKHDDWEVANGKWAIKGGIYQVEKGGKAEHSLVGEEEWDNYTVEAKVRMDEGNWAGVVFRAQSEMEYYIYYLNVQNNKSELWKHSKGAWDTRVAITSNIPAAGKLKIKNGDWFDVKVIVEGNTFQLHINDELQDEKEDGTYKTGKIGVWAWETGASFDDVTITGDNVKDTLAVEARQKLATTWGRLKQVN